MYDENYKFTRVYSIFIYIFILYTFVRKLYNNELYKF